MPILALVDSRLSQPRIGLKQSIFFWEMDELLAFLLSFLFQVKIKDLALY